MADKIFDLELQIMSCWNITEDIDAVTAHFVDSPSWAGDHFSPEACDALMNKYFGIKELYEVKFEILFKTFEDVCREYHTLKNERESFSWPDYKEPDCDGMIARSSIDDATPLEWDLAARSNR